MDDPMDEHSDDNDQENQNETPSISISCFRVEVTLFFIFSLQQTIRHLTKENFLHQERSTPTVNMRRIFLLANPLIL